MNDMLLKNLLKEDPDDGLARADIEIGRARAQGWKMNPDRKLPTDPYSKEAICFIADEKTNQLVYRLNDEESNESAYHYVIHGKIKEFQVHPEKFSIVSGPHGDMGIVFLRGDEKDSSVNYDVTWFLGISDPEKVKSIANSFDWAGKNYRTSLGASGRLWPLVKYIAFWNKKASVMPLLDTVLDLMKKFGAKPEECIYEFIDSKKLYVYRELDKATGTAKRSDDEISDLMKKQHLDPNAKKKLAVMAGLQQKKDVGFDFQAQRDMMRPAVEELASPLLKNILKENPDNLNITVGQAATLKTKGFDPKKMRLAYYDQPGAVTFIFEVKSKELLYSESSSEGSLTHPEMGEEIIHYWHKPQAFDLYNGVGDEGASLEPSENLDVGPGGTELPIYALNIKSAVELKKYLRGLEDLPLHGDIPRKDSKFIMGRFWPIHKAISFWKKKADVLPHIETFSKLSTVFGLGPTQIVWEFLDVEHIFTYDELNTQHGKVRSDAEQIELMKKQHINPNAKKKLAALQGNMNQKVHTGFEDIPAKRDASMPALQELLSKIVSESPDYYSGNKNYGSWRDDGALTFLTFPTFCILGGSSGFTHQGLMMALKKCKADMNTDALEETGILCSNEAELLKDLRYGTLQAYFEGGSDDRLNEGSNYEEKTATPEESEDIDVGPDFRDLPNGLSGRAWTKPSQRVISFWNKQSKVLKLWPQVQDMFEHFPSKFEDISTYTVDWIERVRDSEIPMTPASSIDSGKIIKKDEPDLDKDGQMNFINKMFNNPDQLKSLSKDQLKDVREKMHVFEPEVKAQIMKLSGKFVNKAAEIADALGMTVAEFNHLTQVAEANTSS